MSEDMSIESYLAKGGVLSNPHNVPPRYRAELLKLMTSFVDSELAGAAGFADIINLGPGIKSRIAAAKIVLEKTDHADMVLKLMAEFGVDAERYANHHPWTARLDRDAAIGTQRVQQDMRLAVFNYPLTTWADAVVMNLLMGRAVCVQLADFQMVSYQPLAEVFRTITPVEARHAELAEEGLVALIADTDAATLQTSVDYWWPRVAASFGAAGSDRIESLKTMGLRRNSPDEMRTRWQAEAAGVLKQIGLSPA
ncbi:Phenylacetic acid catabolic protein [Halocynthiibacter namhaensis]|uniref:Phenylacetic acid catabolic protein n=1 Tax=Halocynthiibacter namhaensis TaxID=1290553 RepID=UPI0005799D18|nr:Phenylacetic acid catabolic protein [Halocynthiibacter namhaensis]